MAQTSGGLWSKCCDDRLTTSGVIPTKAASSDTLRPDERALFRMGSSQGGLQSREASCPLPGASVSSMKKMPTRSEEKDEMRPEYDFDYSKARRNPYAARLKGHSVAVLLAPDVAPSFPTADSVNDILRAVINAVPRPPRRPVRLKAQASRKAG